MGAAATAAEKGVWGRREGEGLVRRRLFEQEWYRMYRNADEIQARLASLASKHRGYCRLTKLPLASEEGRDIPALVVGKNAPSIDLSGGKSVQGPWVLVLGGQHAREWISVMAAVYTGERMLEGMASAVSMGAVAPADVRSLAELLEKVTAGLRNRL